MVGRSIIQDHSFSKVRNGEDANFWDDSWKKMPKIMMHQNLGIGWDKAREIGILKVNPFWKEEKDDKDYHEWNPID